MLSLKFRDNISIEILFLCYLEAGIIPVRKIDRMKIAYNRGENELIRKIKEEEYKLLEDFLYEAIFIPEGMEPPEKSIINSPELKVYIEEFGKFKNDLCYVAELEGKVVGTVWVRIMKDYGHVDDETPSLAISLYPEYRGMGIGTELMNGILMELKKKGYKQVSLSVQKNNYAVKMYQKVGFIIFNETEEEYIMINCLQDML